MATYLVPAGKVRFVDISTGICYQIDQYLRIEISLSYIGYRSEEYPSVPSIETTIDITIAIQSSGLILPVSPYRSL